MEFKAFKTEVAIVLKKRIKLQGNKRFLHTAIWILPEVSFDLCDLK